MILGYESMYEQDPAFFGCVILLAVAMFVAMIGFFAYSMKSMRKQHQAEREFLTGFYKDYGNYMISRKK